MASLVESDAVGWVELQVATIFQLGNVVDFSGKLPSTVSTDGVLHEKPCSEALPIGVIPTFV